MKSTKSLGKRTRLIKQVTDSKGRYTKASHKVKFEDFSIKQWTLSHRDSIRIISERLDRLYLLYFIIVILIALLIMWR